MFIISVEEESTSKTATGLRWKNKYHYLVVTHFIFLKSWLYRRDSGSVIWLHFMNVTHHFLLVRQIVSNLFFSRCLAFKRWEKNCLACSTTVLSFVDVFLQVLVYHVVWYPWLFLHFWVLHFHPIFDHFSWFLVWYFCIDFLLVNPRFAFINLLSIWKEIWSKSESMQKSQLIQIHVFFFYKKPDF